MMFILLLLFLQLLILNLHSLKVSSPLFLESLTFNLIQDKLSWQSSVFFLYDLRLNDLIIFIVNTTLNHRRYKMKFVLIILFIIRQYFFCLIYFLRLNRENILGLFKIPNEFISELLIRRLLQLLVGFIVLTHEFRHKLIHTTLLCVESRFLFLNVLIFLKLFLIFIEIRKIVLFNQFLKSVNIFLFIEYIPLRVKLLLCHFYFNLNIIYFIKH